MEMNGWAYKYDLNVKSLRGPIYCWGKVKVVKGEAHTFPSLPFIHLLSVLFTPQNQITALNLI